MTQINSRRDKLSFLKDVVKRRRSLCELTAKRSVIIHSYSWEPESEKAAQREIIELEGQGVKVTHIKFNLQEGNCPLLETD